MRSSGFTLIELIVMIAIVSSMIMISVPMFSKYTHSNVKVSYDCSSVDKIRYDQFIDNCMIKHGGSYSNLEAAKQKCIDMANVTLCNKNGFNNNSNSIK